MLEYLFFYFFIINIKKVLTSYNFICIILFAFADVAHLVERHLAKVEVASSSLVIRSIFAPVAQLDRVSGYEPEGQGFESLPARQNKVITSVITLFFCVKRQTGTRTPTRRRRTQKFLYNIKILKNHIDFFKTL